MKRCVDEVDIFLGSDSTFDFSTGNTYPALVRPWGMTAWSPQTRESRWFFHRDDPKLQGLRATHQPSPWIGDYGHLLLMPFVGSPGVNAEARSSSYVWDSEGTGPGGCRLQLLRDGIDLELAPTERCAALRMQYRHGAPSLMLSLFEGEGDIEIDIKNSEVRGWTRANSGGVPGNFALHFVMRFDCAIASVGVVDQGRVAPGRYHIAGCAPQAYVVFDRQHGGTVNARVATSFVGRDQAHINLERETAGRTLEQLRDETDAAWNRELSRINIEEPLALRRQFYSLLYRCLQFPRSFYELDGRDRPVHYSPYDGRIHDGVLYADIGFWDAHRTLFPLLSLVYPQRLGEMVQGWLNAYREGGWLPRWSSPGYRNSMVGSHAEIVLAEAIVKNIAGFDRDLAYEAIRKSATVTGDIGGLYGRLGLKEYDQLGFVPADRFDYSVSRTLDAAHCDSAVAAAARCMGHDQDAAYFAERSLSYRKLYDAETGFMRPRNFDGRWVEPFDATEWGGGYCEGGPWQYLWAAPHDAEGLIELVGGPAETIRRLEQMLTMVPAFKVGSYPGEIHEMTEMVRADFGNYAHSNQPVHHNLMLFAKAGAPELTRHWVQRVAREMYTAEAFPGDEDNGEMSAWYIFATLGLYPLSPADAKYILTGPMLTRATILPDGGGELIIEAANDQDWDHLIGESLLNGEPLHQTTVHHRDLLGRTKLRCNGFSCQAVAEPEGRTTASKETTADSLRADQPASASLPKVEAKV